MHKRNYKVIKANNLRWLWKHRTRLYSSVLLHRKEATNIEDASKEIFSKAMNINVLSFFILLIDYRIGLINLTETTFIIPTHLVLGKGASSLIKVGLLFENPNTPSNSIRRVAFRIPFFDHNKKTGYKPKSYYTNEIQKALYDHPNLEHNALFLGTIEDPKAPFPLEYTVEEIWEQAYLYNVKHKTDCQLLDTLEIILGMAKALEYLHSFNLIHRDIKPWNVLVKRNDNGHLDVQVTDLETIRPETDRKVPMRGTPGFVAPETEASFETIQGTCHAIQTMASDMYALGQSILYFRHILLQRAIARTSKYSGRISDSMQLKLRTTVERRPLGKTSFKQLIDRLTKHGAFKGLPYFDLILNTLEDLARQLCDKNPDKRPSASEVADLLQSLMDVTEFKSSQIQEI